MWQAIQNNAPFKILLWREVKSFQKTKARCKAGLVTIFLWMVIYHSKDCRDSSSLRRACSNRPISLPRFLHKALSLPLIPFPICLWLLFSLYETLIVWNNKNHFCLFQTTSGGWKQSPALRERISEVNAGKRVSFTRLNSTWSIGFSKKQAKQQLHAIKGLQAISPQHPFFDDSSFDGCGPFYHKQSILHCVCFDALYK